MLLIGISGHKQSGKDTTVDIVRRMLVGASVPIERISLADPLKEEVAEFLSNTNHFDILTFFNENIKDDNLYREIIDSIFPKLIDHPEIVLLVLCETETAEKILIDQILTKEQYLEIFHDPAQKGRFRKLLQWWGTEFRRSLDEQYWVKKGIEAIQKLDSKWQGQVIIFMPDIRFPDEAQMIKDLGGLVFRIERPTKEVDLHPSETVMDNYTDFDCVLYNNGTMEQFYQEVYEKTSLLFIDFFKTL